MTEKPEQLRLDYIQNLKSKLEEIDRLVNLIEADIEDDKSSGGKLKQLKWLVYSLVGPSMRFGFPDINESAEELEVKLKDEFPYPFEDFKQQESGSLRGLIEPFRETVQESLETETKQLPDIPDTETTESSREASYEHLLFYTQTEELQEYLSEELPKFGYETECFGAIGELRTQIRGKTPPGALIVDISNHTDEQKSAVFEMVENLERESEKEFAVIAISDDNSLETRLKAVNADVNDFFVRPIDLDLFIERVDSLTTPEQSQPGKVLIVDQGEQTGPLYKTHLSEMGFEAELLSSPENLLETLAEFHPEVVVMDLFFPECTGLDLAEVIRQNPQFLNIPIIFTSSPQKLQDHRESIQKAGADYLEKPVNLNQLETILHARVERSRKLRAHIQRDRLTGLLNHTNFRHELDIEARRAERENHDLTLAFLDLDNFKSINDKYGHASGDRVLRNLAKLLKSRLRATDVIGRYGGEEFGIIFPSTDPTGATVVLDNIRANFAKIRHQTHEDGWITATFSYGVATYREGEHLNELCNRADRAMYKAKRDGRNRGYVAQATKSN